MIGVGENLGSIWAEMRLRFDQMEKDLADAKAVIKQADGEINEAVKETEKISRSMSKETSKAFTQVGMGMTAAGAAVSAGLGVAVKTAADFEKAMSRVGALSGATGVELTELQQTALELGATTAFSASEAAEGMQFLAMAGYETNEVIAAMPGLLNAAAAGQTELGTAADIVSNILGGFGLRADETARVADVLTAAFTSSNTSLEMLGDTMKYVAPVAAAAGFSLEEMAAAAGILGDVGIQASQAGTALRMSILRILDPPSEAKKVMDDLGITVTDQEGRIQSLADIIGQLQDAFSKLSEAERVAATGTIFGAESVAAMLAIVDQGPEALSAFTKELENSGGKAAEIASVQLDNLAGSMTELEGAMETASIAVGTVLAPAIRQVTEIVMGLVNRFNALPDPVKEMIVKGMALAAVLLAIGGPALMLIGALPNIAAGIQTVALVMKILNASIIAVTKAMVGLLLANPILLAIAAAIALVAGAAYLIWKNWDTIGPKLMALWENIKQTAANVWNAVKDMFVETWDAIVTFVQELPGRIQSGLAELFTNLPYEFGEMLGSILRAVIDWTLAVIEWHLKLPGRIWDALKEAARVSSQAWDDIKKRTMEAVSGAVRASGEWFGRLPGKLAEGLNQAKERLLQAPADLKTAAGTIGKAIVDGFKDHVMGLPGLIWDVLANVGRRIRDAASNLLTATRETAGQIWEGFKSGLGIHSPSYLEEAMANIVAASRETLVSLKDDFRSLDSLKVRPQLELAGGYGGGSWGAATLPAPTPGPVVINGPLVSVEKMEVRSEDDIRAVSRGLYDLLQPHMRSRGVK